ncbi:hypothetical protein PHMEG_0009007 [Phytophthora megakarya]|uniref:Uncharacterized protein n=1 Tax=Phytophthora megakarya TaxID=4795 RepID=A0A225WHS7_9STRA|nr:hypothetical protein PHMEG_0009007 [Phytophthora megakarya]
MPFKKTLHRNGWTAKRSPGRCLDVLCRYIRPDGDPNGNEGDDYSIGEHALADYYNCIYRVEMDNNGELANTGATGREDMIDTSPRIVTFD